MNHRKIGILIALLTGPGALAATSRDTLVVQQAAGISTLDPTATYDTFSSQVVENIYETLWTRTRGPASRG